MFNLKVFFFNFSLILAVSILITGCAPKAETTAVLEFNAVGSGPFFSGPNSLIAEYTVNLKDLEGLAEVSAEQIAEVKVKTISLVIEEDAEMNFGAFSNATLQLVSGNSAMQTIAIKNPISSSTNEISLDVSQEVDLAAYFKDEKFSLVLDLDFKEDLYEDDFGTTIDMQLSVKHN
ncbi:MAG: hypothetical protein AB8B53_05935 [Flavobacteriales bacterium]